MPKGKKLNINSDVEFIKAVIKKGTVQVGTDGEWTVDYGFEMYDITDDPSSNNSGSYSNRTSLINNGRVNLYLSEVTLTNSYIENNGYVETYSSRGHCEIMANQVSYCQFDIVKP